jgi:hypothetical protein
MNVQQPVKASPARHAKSCSNQGWYREALAEHPLGFLADTTEKEKAPIAGGFRLSVWRRSRTYQWWRWGELNPRPEQRSWVFYGCSFSIALLGPGHTLKRVDQQTQP